MSTTIRLATEDDVDDIYKISCSVHLSPLYRRLIPSGQYDRFQKRYVPSGEGLARFYEKFVARLYDPEWHAWVAESDGMVVGYTLAHKTESAVTLKSLFVVEEMQGKGIGRALFDTSCKVASEGQVIVLEVIKANHHAVNLYAKQGFIEGKSLGSFYGALMIQMYKN